MSNDKFHVITISIDEVIKNLQDLKSNGINKLQMSIVLDALMVWDEKDPLMKPDQKNWRMICDEYQG